MSSDLTAKLGYGPLNSTPFTFSKADLTTTWVNVPLPGTLNAVTGARQLADGTVIRGLHCMITNRSATNTAAWTKTKSSAVADAPTSTFPAFSTANDTVAGGPIPLAAAGGVQVFAITDTSTGLWVIGSAAATDVIVNFFVET